MKGKIRNLFPGGNTPEGFYSYYQYVLGQKEASSIICLKGGPGTGKSSFMKDIGSYFSGKGEEVDYFWCSSDPESLDGVLLKNRKVAILDGTSPHIIDPVTPGAVDSILNLGDFWDGQVIKEYKDYIMQSNVKIKRWFEYAYCNLRAAADLLSSVTCTYNDTMLPGELYKDGAGIINRELSSYPVTLSEGRRKKYFASAITHKGVINHLQLLLADYEKVYCFMAPLGFSTDRMLRIISENVVHRGFTVEEFYCPMAPGARIEHLLIPELKLAFTTFNSYHECELQDTDKDIRVLEMRDYVDWNSMEEFKDNIAYCEAAGRALVDKAIECLRKAKKEHDVLESYYIPNMNFQKIEDLKGEIIGKIERKVL